MRHPHLLKAVRAIVGIYREFEQTTRSSDLSLAQYRLMLYLTRGPRRAGAIAAAGAIAKPTVSLTVNALREKGWVESLPDADGRVSLVKTTAAGKRRMAGLERDLGAALSRLLPREDLEALCDALVRALLAMRATREERLKAVEHDLTE